MPTDVAAKAARLALLEAAILVVLREAKDEGYEGLMIEATADDGQVAIDVQYLGERGIPVAGASL